MAQLDIRLLGNPEIYLDGATISTDRRKAVALLAYLASTDQRHSREHLATFFWPDSDQSRALAYLRRTLWEINNMLGSDWLAAARESVVLPLNDDVMLDTAVFTSALTSSQPDVAALTDAAALYRGDFMAGFTLRDSPAFDDWQTLQSQTFRLQLGQLLETLITTHEAAGSWTEAEAGARRWLTLDPLQEAAHRALMRLHARQGRRVQALRQYERCATTLDEELGIAPSPQTEALAAAIRAGDIAAESSPAATAVAPPAEAKAAPHSFLPAPPTAFVGRRSELAEISSLLTNDQARLLTLLGPGGSGKTRLAIEAARRQQDIFADGVRFVGLATRNTPDQLVPAIAKTVGLRLAEESGDVEQQLWNYLRPRNLLLVLDNVEHLLAGGIAGAISDLLAAAPSVHVLATSRERLQIRGERLYRVAGMTVAPETISLTDSGAYSALQLFTQSARLVQPDFSLTADNLPAVVGICRLVEGMPLGIELAAGWLALLTPTEVKAEIQRSLDFLQTELRDVPDRQRSLRAVFNYSWALLTPEEKQVFPRLAIFQGGFTRETVTAVTGASLRTLMGLVHKSLLHRQDDGRFYIHELLRQYATEKLQAEPETWLAMRHAHADHFLNWLLAITPQMKGPAQKEAFNAIENELSNIRAAWLWHVVHQNYALPLETLGALFIYHIARGTTGELRSLLEIVYDDVEATARETAVAGAKPGPTQLFNAALLGMLSYAASEEIISEQAIDYSRKAVATLHAIGMEGNLTLPYILASSTYAWRVDREEGLGYAQTALDIMRLDGDKWYLSLFLLIVSGLHWSLRRRDLAKEMLEEGVSLARAIGDDLLLSLNLGNLASLVGEEGKHDQALAYHEECCDIHRRLNNLQSVAQSLYHLGAVSDRAGRYPIALDYYQQSLAIFKTLGDRMRIADSLSWISQVQRRLGQYDAALVSREQSQTLYQEIDDTNGIGWSYYEAGELYRLRGELERADRFYDRAQAVFAAHDKEIGLVQTGLSFSHRGRGTVALLTGRLQEAESWLAQSHSYSEMAYDDWGLSNLHYMQGLLALAKNELAQAGAEMRQALELAVQVGNLGAQTQALVGLAQWAQAAGNRDEAVYLAQTIAAEETAWAETRETAVAILSAADAGLEGETAVITDLIQQYLPA